MVELVAPADKEVTENLPTEQEIFKVREELVLRNLTVSTDLRTYPMLPSLSPLIKPTNFGY